MLGQRRVDLDHIEGSPVGLHPLARPAPAGQPDGPDGLHVADPAHRPGTGTLHRGEHLFAALLVDVALDQGARVEIEHQRSSSRSARTIAEAERPLRSGLGGAPGPRGGWRPTGERWGGGGDLAVGYKLAQALVTAADPRRDDVGDGTATSRHPDLLACVDLVQDAAQARLQLSNPDLTHVTTLAREWPHSSRLDAPVNRGP